MPRKAKTNPVVNTSVSDAQTESPVESQAATVAADKLTQAKSEIKSEMKSEKENQCADEISPDDPASVSTAVADDPLAGFTLVIPDGKALKLSPKTKKSVFFQLGLKDEDHALHIRMSGNEGGGLHSKEWVPLEAIFTLLDQQRDKSIKSTVLKPVFKGSSANNCGFMAAVLRCESVGLLAPSGQGVFSHRLTDGYEANKARLLSMAN